jgi:hypothetical protein
MGNDLSAIEGLGPLLAIMSAIILASGLFGERFAPYQEKLSQGIIDAFNIPTRFRLLTNIGVGIVVAVVFTLVAAIYIGSYLVVPAGILAGILSAVNASNLHDSKKEQVVESGEQLVLKGI